MYATCRVKVGWDSSTLVGRNLKPITPLEPRQTYQKEAPVQTNTYTFPVANLIYSHKKKYIYDYIVYVYIYIYMYPL